MFKSLLKLLGGVAGEALIDDVKDKVSETVEDVKHKIEEAVEKAIKKVILVFLVFTGLVFGLVGVGIYLSQTTNAFAHGLGFVLIGAVLLLLALFASYMRK